MFTYTGEGIEWTGQLLTRPPSERAGPTFSSLKLSFERDGKKSLIASSFRVVFGTRVCTCLCQTTTGLGKQPDGTPPGGIPANHGARLQLLRHQTGVRGQGADGGRRRCGHRVAATVKDCLATVFGSVVFFCQILSAGTYARAYPPYLRTYLPTYLAPTFIDTCNTRRFLFVLHTCGFISSSWLFLVCLSGVYV